MPGSELKQIVACSFIQTSKEVKRTDEMEEGRNGGIWDGVY